MDKKEAEKWGKILLRKMKGRNWKLRVWENLGWHYSVYLPVGEGAISIYPFSYDHPKLEENVKYHANFSRHYTSGDEAIWSDLKAFKDPNKAVKHKLKLAKKYSDSMKASVDQAIDAAIHCLV